MREAIEIDVYVHMLTLHCAALAYIGAQNPKMARCRADILKKIIEDELRKMFPDDDLHITWYAYVLRSPGMRGGAFFKVLGNLGFKLRTIYARRNLEDTEAGGTRTGEISGHIQMDVISSSVPDAVVVVDGSGIIVRAFEYLKAQYPETKRILVAFPATIHSALKAPGLVDKIIELDGRVIEALENEDGG